MTRRNRTLGVLMAMAVAVVPASALAQSWGGGRLPREGACFYRDINFRGTYFCVEAGDELDSLPRGANDEVSSIRIFGGAEVSVHASTRLRGDARQFTRDVRDLTREGMNDEISSVQVHPRVRGGGFGVGRRGGASLDPDRVIRRAYEDLLEREPDASGLREFRRRMIDDGWTEQDVRDHIRRSPEYREKQTMTPARAREIVRRAYLAVLQREPDAASSGFVERVLREGWTQQQVERELRRSDEYRNRPR